MSRSTNPVPQFFDESGGPIADGSMFYFESGTTTQKVTFADAAQTIENTHPVLLDGSGRLPNVFFTGSAKQILVSSNGAQQWERDPVGGDTGLTFGADWVATQTYSVGFVIIASDGEYYRSLVNNNSNNDPTTASASWEQLQFGRVWNTNVNYAITGSAYGSDGKLYNSQIADNLGNDPISDFVSWKSSSTGQVVTTVITASDPAWTPQDDVRSIKLIVVGGGGGGGGADGQGAGTAAAASGGGGGGYSSIVKTSIDSSYAITIGAGGAGGVAGNNSGSNGGNTVVSSSGVSITANGGSGGLGMLGTSGNSGAGGGNGAVATGGDINIRGNDAITTTIVSGQPATLGYSGASFYGGGLEGLRTGAGADSTTIGSGGSGAGSEDVATNFKGGDGADGAVIIKEFF